MYFVVGVWTTTEWPLTKLQKMLKEAGQVVIKVNKLPFSL